MRNLKFLGVFAGGMAALLCAVLFGTWLLVNPNAYKGRIVAAVQESTGRELQLPGDIKLSVLPWVALELGPASLGNPPGFSDEPFLSFTHATIRVRLLPLLRRRLEVARVEVDGLDLRLRKNAQGRGNWQTEPAQPAKADADHTEAVRGLQSLANIRIQNGRVAYAGNTVDKLNLETGSLTADRHIPVSLTFEATRAPSGERLAFSAKFDVSEQDRQHVLLQAASASGTLKTSGDGAPVNWELSTPLLSLNVAQQSMEAPAFTLSYAGAQLTGSALATHILVDWNVAGSLSLAPLVLREFASRLSMALPATRDPAALSRLAATTDFAYDSKAMSLSHLQMRLDDTQIQGNLTMLAGETEALKFDIAADRINLDRYRAPQGGAASRESNSSASAQPAKSEKPLEASGTLTITAAQFARQDLANVRIAVAIKDQVTLLSPIEAQVDGGRASGEITWDNRGATPTVSLDGQLTDIDMTRLLANAGGKRRLSGRATLNLKVTAHADAMLKTLNGHLDANLADGALQGIDVGYEIQLAQALIDRSIAPPSNSTNQTPFQAFKLSAQITNGVAATRDLTIASQALSVTGQGSANLPTKGIDFKLLANIVTAPARNTDIPLKVTGTYVDPVVRPDIEAVAKDRLKQKLQDVLKKNGLQGLFSK